MATPIVMKDWGVAAKVVPSDIVKPIHQTFFGRACVCIPLVLMTTPIDARGLPVESDWAEMTAPPSEAFLNAANEIFSTTFDMSQFDPPTAPVNKHEAAYIEAEGSECLTCGAANPEGGSIDFEGGSIYQSMSCASCGAIWTDGYTLDRVLLVEKEDDDSE